MNRAARLLFWTALVFTLVMAWLPHPPRLVEMPGDKWQHALAFLTLTLLAGLAYRGLSLLRLLTAFAVLGALIEFVQAIPALHRDADAADWLADMAAVLLALALLGLWRRFSRAAPSPAP